MFVESDAAIPEVAGVIERLDHKDAVELVLDETASPQGVLEALVQTGIPIDRFEVATPSLHEIFLQIVGDDHE